MTGRHADQQARLAWRLDRLLDERGLSLSDLQRRTGLSYSTLHAIKQNTPGAITYATLARLCEALRVVPGTLLEYVPDPPEETP